MFSYLVCCACYVNLPPAAYRVDDLHAALFHPSTHIRTVEVATSEVRRLCLPLIAYVSQPTCPQFSHQRRFVFGLVGCSTETLTIESVAAM
jgi:hypothetical protein